MQLSNNLFAYSWQGQDNNCNSYLIANCLESGRHLLIDPGHMKTQGTGEPALEMLLKGMQEDGVDPAGISLILLTHCHPDHTESAAFFQKRLNTRIAIHSAEADIYGQMGGIANLILKEGELNLGRKHPLKLQVIHTPGHSPGHINIFWPDEKTLFSGDLVFYRSTGRTDLPGSSLADMKESIRRISALELDWLLCGHAYGHPGIIQGSEEIRENFQSISQQLMI